MWKVFIIKLSTDSIMNDIFKNNNLKEEKYTSLIREPQTNFTFNQYVALQSNIGQTNE